jgi:vacuolar protein sorting-associated protein 41
MDPIRLIRRIKNGLEIPGLKEALIKILQDFHLQISLLEGCQEILNGDGGDFSRKLQANQTAGFFITCNILSSCEHCLYLMSITAKTICPICSLPLLSTPPSLLLLFLCRHVVHAGCVSGGEDLPHQPDPALIGMGVGIGGRGLGGKIAL